MRTTRHTRTVALVLALLAALPAHASAAAPATTPAPQKTITYSIGSMGLDLSARERQTFADVVDATLNDPRGWSLNGAIRYRRTERGRFEVVLASASTVGRFGGCSSSWSCRVGRLVLINEMRWTGASHVFPGPANLHPYRNLVINHEVGHALGFGHRGCAGSGQDAYVMQQQSIRLDGCRANPWPRPSERSALAHREGVRVGQRPAWLQAGVGASGIAIGMSRREVRARIGAPQHVTRSAGRVRERFDGARLVVEIRNDRVVTVTTRSELDRNRLGIGVGTSASRVRRAAGARCTPADGTGVVRCALGRDERAGDRPTTWVIHRGRVVAVRIALRLRDRPVPPAPPTPEPVDPDPAAPDPVAPAPAMPA